MKIVRAGESDASLNRIKAYLITGDCIEPEGILFKNSYVVAGNLVAPNIKADYNLTVLGSIDCNKLEVNNNLTVIGQLVAKQVDVGGEVLVQEEFHADEVYVKGTLQASRVNLKQAVIHKQLISLSTVNIMSCLETHGMIIATEGISGSGTITSPVTISGEYNDAKLTDGSKKLILSEANHLTQFLSSEPSKPPTPKPSVNDKELNGIEKTTYIQEKKELSTVTQVQRKNRNRLL